MLESTQPLVEGFLDLNQQLQSNGFDLSVREVAIPRTAGIIAEGNDKRKVSELAPLTFDKTNQIHLAPGPYIITFNEIVHLPADIMALGRTRSSLLRCGVVVNTAVWDAGYSGRSQSLLVVHNPLGFTLEKNARVMQLVFFRLTGETEKYNGIYQGENIK